MAEFQNVSLEAFRQAHPEDLGADGKIRVCIGGGAGFIGSHIAKRLRAEVVILHFVSCLILSRVVMWFVLTGKTMSLWP